MSSALSSSVQKYSSACLYLSLSFGSFSPVSKLLYLSVQFIKHDIFCNLPSNSSRASHLQSPSLITGVMSLPSPLYSFTIRHPNHSPLRPFLISHLHGLYSPMPAINTVLCILLQYSQILEGALERGNIHLYCYVNCCSCVGWW